MKYRKIMFWLRMVSLFFLGLIVAVIIALSQVSLESLRGHVLGALRTATGYPVQIDGMVSWKFSLRPRIELNQVRIANASWAKEKFGFSAERMDVTLDLVSLLRNRPTIRSVSLYDTTVKIEKNDKGEYSVQQLEKPVATETVETNKTNKTPELFPIKDVPFGKIEIENLSFDDGEYKFFISGAQLRYIHLKKKREFHGWIKPHDEIYPFIIVFSEYNDERKVYPVKIALSTGIAEGSFEAGRCRFYGNTAEAHRQDGKEGFGDLQKGESFQTALLQDPEQSRLQTHQADGHCPGDCTGIGSGTDQGSHRPGRLCPVQQQ